MLTFKRISFASLLVLVLLATATAQDRPGVMPLGSSTITAAATDERVRITAPSSVVQMHVEVYAASGEKLFDQEIRGGNVFDWHLQDGQAQRLAPGNYVCVVTAKSVSGRLTQKIGTVSVAEKSVSVQPAESPQLSAAQAQYIGPVEENSSWTVAGMETPQTPTVIAHDGTDGQMIRGRGALTFRIGNFFSGMDTEQMRLTEDGNLGIGTSQPQSKLDVAGAIRAERFLVVKPQLAKGDKAATDTQAANAADSVQPLIAGTGTLNHIAKWTPDGSTLGDSGIFEAAGGLVGIGTTSPSAKLTVNANAGIPPIAPLGVIAHFVNADENNTFLTADSYGNANIHSDFLFRRARGTMAAPTAVQTNDIIGQIQARGYGATGFATTSRSSIRLAAAENWTDSNQGAYLSFLTTPNLNATINVERMRITDAGDVGIGISAPIAKLEVFGGKGVFAESDLATFPAVDTLATGTSAYGVHAVSSNYRGLGTSRNNTAFFSLFVDKGSSESVTSTIAEVAASLEVVGNLTVDGSKSGYVVDIMQNAGATALETGDVVVIVGSSAPVLGQIPVVTVRKATNANDTAVAGIVDQIWYAPDAATKTAYETQKNAVRTAMAARVKAQAPATSTSGGNTKPAEEAPMPEVKITDEQGTLHALSDEVSAGPGGYISVVTLGSYKMVKVDASFGAIRAGDLLTTSTTPGYAMKATDKVAAIGAIIGKALGNLDSGMGIIPVLVMPK